MTSPLAFLLLTLLQPAPAPVGQGPGEEAPETVRLDAWPEVPKGARESLKKDVQRLRKARTEEGLQAAVDALTALGAAAAPELVKALSKEKDEAARARIEEVLDDVTGPAHTRLLAQSFDHKSVQLRIWAQRRVASFPDPGTRAAAEKAWQKVSKKGDDADSTERLAAALALTASGSTQGLDTLVVAAGGKRWSTWKENLRDASVGARGAGAEYLTELLEERARATVVGSLRLLARSGSERTTILRIRVHLDSEDSQIRIAAINALRGIVDGAEPVEKLSVFDSIEKAKTWKERVN